RLTSTLPPGIPSHLASAARDSVGAALEIGTRANKAGHPALAASIHHAASTAFFHGLGIACLLAAGVSAAGALAALILLPAHPSRPPPAQNPHPPHPPPATTYQRAATTQDQPAPAPR